MSEIIKLNDYAKQELIDKNPIAYYSDFLFPVAEQFTDANRINTKYTGFQGINDNYPILLEYCEQASVNDLRDYLKFIFNNSKIIIECPTKKQRLKLSKILNLLSYKSRYNYPYNTDIGDYLSPFKYLHVSKKVFLNFSTKEGLIIPYSHIEEIILGVYEQNGLIE